VWNLTARARKRLRPRLWRRPSLSKPRLPGRSAGALEQKLRLHLRPRRVCEQRSVAAELFQFAAAIGAGRKMLLQFCAIVSLQSVQRVEGEIIGELFVYAHFKIGFQLPAPGTPLKHSRLKRLS